MVWVVITIVQMPYIGPSYTRIVVFLCLKNCRTDPEERVGLMRLCYMFVTNGAGNNAVLCKSVLVSQHPKQ